MTGARSKGRPAEKAGRPLLISTESGDDPVLSPRLSDRWRSGRDLLAAAQHTHGDGESDRGDTCQCGDRHCRHLLGGCRSLTPGRADHAMTAINLFERPEKIIRIPTLVGVVTQNSLSAVLLVGDRIAWFASGVHLRSSSGWLDMWLATGPGTIRAGAESVMPLALVYVDFDLRAIVRHTGQVARTRRHPSVCTFYARQGLGWPGEHDRGG